LTMLKSLRICSVVLPFIWHLCAACRQSRARVRMRDKTLGFDALAASGGGQTHYAMPAHERSRSEGMSK